MACEPERRWFDNDGTPIELLTWGRVGAPGLLFLHGNSAHADWWSFIAPFFAETHRCAAISWSGMGRSGWRSRYGVGVYADEIVQAIGEAGLAASGNPPIVVAHSFGGLPLLHLCVRQPDQVAGALLIDTILPPNRPPPSAEARGTSPLYATLADALARFRFLPSQDTDFPAIADHVARHGLHEVSKDEGLQGWTWRFDPELWVKMDRAELTPELRSVTVPTGLIYGERSQVVSRDRVAHARATLPDCLLAVEVPGAAHHIMADQPLALVASLRLAIDQLAPSHG